MATKLVRYDLTGGGSILVEEAVEDHGGLAGHGGVIEEAGQKFEDALAMLRPATAAVLNEVRSLIDSPDEVELELGFSLKAEFGAVIAKTAGEGSFKLSLKWKPPGKS